ncbi:MAG: aspartyl/asparaginyl beta-hydroxylase domain-containing protein [Sphingomonadaceae bacterium]|nr:aspartyl/asparaginyl beta-hydroxylase domain-containing protein [Sphingomonadaceae bacterium]
MAVAALDSDADRAAARGDFETAATLLAQACAGDPDDGDRWLKLAAMRRARRDFEGALEAVNGALAVDPLGFVPLLVKAGILDALDRPAEAAEFCGAAIFHAPPDAELPAPLRRQLAFAREKHTAFQAREEARLAALMAVAAASADAEQARRLDRFRSNTLRLTKPYHCAPTHFHYPGLIEREFHDRSLFPWLAELEAATAVIRAEYEALIAAPDARLVPYIQYDEAVPLRQWAALNHSRRWSAAHLLAGGARVEANAAHCPETLALLARLPQPAIRGRSPNAMFSLLAPGAHIPPHHGISNARLVCHLPLIVPEGCWFRVGAERRTVEEGGAWVFDDTIEHEAANESDAPRVILIFDVWHPGLSAIERDGAAVLIAEHGPGGDGGL